MFVGGGSNERGNCAYRWAVMVVSVMTVVKATMMVLLVVVIGGGDDSSGEACK